MEVVCELVFFSSRVLSRFSSLLPLSLGAPICIIYFGQALARSLLGGGAIFEGQELLLAGISEFERVGQCTVTVETCLMVMMRLQQRRFPLEALSVARARSLMMTID